MLKRLWRFLTKPGVLMVLGIIFLVSAVYYIAPLLSIEGRQRLTVALLVGGLAFVALVIHWIRSYVRARKLTRELQSQARKQADEAGADAKQDIELLEREFERAFDELSQITAGTGVFKQSTVAQLPWIVIMGPPGVGKSTALAASGLHFTPLGRRLQGIGGTRNCTWWLAEEAIFLDTAGRYTVQEDDHAEWLSFLRLLRLHRKRRPIDTVVLQVGMDTIINLEDVEVQRIAVQLRNRLDELLQHLQVRFPVHLIFSKCDRLDGFLEFMGALQNEEKEQPWGFSIDIDQLPPTAFGKVFSERYDALVTSLHARVTLRIGELQAWEEQARALAFPHELARHRDKLELFTDVLFEFSRHRERPWLTSVHLVSPTQEGLLLSGVRRDATDRFGIAPIKVGAIPETWRRPYFVKGFFHRVIADAQDAARPNKSAIRMMRIKQLGTLAAALVACFIVSNLVGRSFHTDAMWLEAIKTETVKLYSMEGVGGVDNATDMSVYNELAVQGRLEWLLTQRAESGLVKACHRLASALLRRSIDKEWIVPMERAIDSKLAQGATWKARNPDGEQFADGYLGLKAAHVIQQDECPGSDPKDTRFWMGSYVAKLWEEQLGDRARDVMPGSTAADMQNRVGYFFAGTQRSGAQLDGDMQAKASKALQGELPEEDVVFYLIAANAGLTGREVQVKGSLFRDDGIQMVFTPTGCEKFLSSSGQGKEWWKCLLDIDNPPALSRNKAYKRFFTKEKEKWLGALSIRMDINGLQDAILALTYLEQGQDSELNQIVDAMGGQALQAERKKRAGSSLAGVQTGSKLGFLKSCYTRTKKIVDVAQSQVKDATCQEAQMEFAPYAEALAEGEKPLAAAYNAYKNALKVLREHLRAIAGSTTGNEQALEMVLETMASKGDLYTATLAREDFFQKLQEGPPRMEAGNLQGLLVNVEQAVWTVLLPPAAKALQEQWTVDLYQPWSDIRWPNPRVEEPVACEQIIAFLQKELSPYVDKNLRPFYDGGNLRMGVLTTFLGEQMPIRPSVASAVENALTISRTLKCPAPPGPEEPAPPPPKPGVPFRMDPRGETCGKPVESMVIFTGEEKYECSASTASCTASPATYDGARLVLKRKDDLGPGTQIRRTGSYDELMAAWQGNHIRFNLDQFCKGMYVLMELQGGSDGTAPKTGGGGGQRKPPEDNRWKNKNLLPQFITGGAG